MARNPLLDAQAAVVTAPGRIRPPIMPMTDDPACTSEQNAPLRWGAGSSWHLSRIPDAVMVMEPNYPVPEGLYRFSLALYVVRLVTGPAADAGKQRRWV